MRDNKIIQVGCVLLPRVGAEVICLRGSALSIAHTMSCIPVIVLARHRICLRIVDMHLVD